MPKYQLGHDKFSFTEMYDSLFEGKLKKGQKVKYKKDGKTHSGKIVGLPTRPGSDFEGKVAIMPDGGETSVAIPVDDILTEGELNELAFVEGSTENAKKTLDAIIGHLEKRKASGADVLGATGRSMLKMANGMDASFKEEKSFSPDQAKWIWKTSVALFKK